MIAPDTIPSPTPLETQIGKTDTLTITANSVVTVVTHHEYTTYSPWVFNHVTSYGDDTFTWATDPFRQEIRDNYSRHTSTTSCGAFAKLAELL